MEKNATTESDIHDPDYVYTREMSKWDDELDSTLKGYRQWQADVITPYLGDRVLEIGGGYGELARLITEKRSFEEYTILEPSHHMYQRAVEKKNDCFPKAALLMLDLENYDKTRMGTYDSIFSIHVLEHIENDAAHVRMCREYLKPGGRLILMAPAFDMLYSNLDKQVGHHRRYTKKKMRDLSSETGFTIELLRYDNFIGFFGWLWVCKIRRLSYAEKDKKGTLVKYFAFFTKYVLPVFTAIEKAIEPPIGLNITAVFKK